MNEPVSRRSFIKGTIALAGSGLVVGCSSNDDLVLMHSNDAPDSQLNSWVHVATSGAITVTIPSVEMGQGVKTSMAMIVAEEMDAEWDDVNVVIAPWNPQFSNGAMRMQITGGSTSISSFWMPMRQVGAMARHALMQTAAQLWSVDVADLRTEKSKVFYQSQSKTYRELADQAAQLNINADSLKDDLVLKNPTDFRLIGHPIARVDVVDKTNGQAQFGIDVQQPGLRIATIAQAPVFGGELNTMTESDALNVRGVQQVVTLPGAVAVVADSYWQAKKGLHALQPSFTEPAESKMSSADISAALKARLDDEGFKPPKKSQQVIELEYEVPYLAHATMEPMNCTVHIQPERCDIWVPSQTQTFTGKAAEAITGLAPEQIFVHITYLGGGFGRRGESDFVEQALLIAQAAGGPIKLVWSREEDTQHDFYRPAAVGRFQIGLDEKNQINHWGNQTAASSIFKRLSASVMPNFLKWVPLTGMIGDPIAGEGAKHVGYIEKTKYDNHIVELPIPVGFWRSVGHSSNAFFVESAMDEVANKLNVDPFDYRRQHLYDPREITVADKAAALANWGKVKTGHFQGIAVHKSFGTYAAEVVELSVNSSKEITLHRITCVVDCGVVVNPNTVKAQLESGIIYGLVAAAHGDIEIVDGRVKQSNFHDYQMLKMEHIPPIDTFIIQSAEAPSGIGEPGTPPIAPALTNALFQATGQRIRTLPIDKHGYRIGRATV